MSVEGDAMVQHEQIRGAENRLQAGRVDFVSRPEFTDPSLVGGPDPGRTPAVPDVPVAGLPVAVNGEWHTSVQASDNRLADHPSTAGRPDNRGDA
jgi:hypothetical protein